MARKFREKSLNCFDELKSRSGNEAIKRSNMGAGRSCTSTATPQAASRRSDIEAISSSHTGAGRSRNRHPITTGSEQAKCYGRDHKSPHGSWPPMHISHCNR